MASCGCTCPIVFGIRQLRSLNLKLFLLASSVDPSSFFGILVRASASFFTPTLKYHSCVPSSHVQALVRSEPSSVQSVRASNTLQKMLSIIFIDCDVTSLNICSWGFRRNGLLSRVRRIHACGGWGKMFVEKKRACVNCDLLFAILIAHCQAAATWFDECSTKNSRQVNLDTTDSHLDLLNWQPIGRFFVDGLHLPPTGTPCVIDALNEAGVFEGGTAQFQHVKRKHQ